MKLTGTGIGSRTALGPAIHMSEPLPEPSAKGRTAGVAVEQARVETSLAAVAADLTAKADQAGGPASDILLAQAQMVNDPTLKTDVNRRIEDGSTAERAVFDAFASFRDMLVGMGGYMAERATDLDDLSQRVRADLQGLPAPGVPNPGHPFILVARDLAPADTALLDLDQVLGLVTSDGGPTSHTAILAREKSIVAVVGVKGAGSITPGQTILVEASTGEIELDPDDAAQQVATEKIAEQRARAAAPPAPGALADGTAMPLLANLGSTNDLEQAVSLGAEGVGLFRTEFMFLDASTAPTVDEQREQYTRLLAAFPGQKVVVRLLDAGADKPLAFLNPDPEENPALGVRGIRALNATPEVLRDQLSALSQAAQATEADLWVMAPMIATVDETTALRAECAKYDLPVTGVMIEVPSAALLADRILAEADFVSIGTNDLTQYTMAADRLLGSVAYLQDPWHPALLSLVEIVGKAGSTTGKPVGICGEAAADPLLAVVLVGLGATSLSMSPSALADVRAELAQHTMEQAQAIAHVAIAAPNADAARKAARELANKS